MATPAPRAAEARPVPEPRRKLEPWQDPAAAPFLRVENVSRHYGEVHAVDQLSLDVYQGEFFALLGPSGCGKTTLLRMLAGFEAPSAGRILIDGQDMAGVPPHRRPVNMMFQSYALFPHMTVEQNVAFGLKQEGVPRPEIRERVARTLELVQMGGTGARRPHQLSGGQRQRVALARAIIKRPKLLLLDEPLAALDKNLRERTQFELVNIQESLGLTFVIVTHDQAEAMTVGSRIAIMREGRIAQQGTPSEIYEFPQSRFVAEFMGDVNVLEGRLVAVEGGMATIESPAAGCAIRAEAPLGATPGHTVWVAVRPEKLSIAKEPPAERGVNCLAGEVFDIGYLGDASVYHVRLDSGPMVRATTVNRRRLVERPITWQDRVWLGWAEDASVVLRQ
ncbi:MAG TPA: polyamine ABC transporter ATP-binding protein [Geminicoccaceae bacterium]|nr:polyamine ABC transporter ATP-binding protein [Geminicoccaceae bacterium]